jgi:hypothetical protein
VQKSTASGALAAGCVMKFKVGDHVRPRSEWRDDPTGVVRRIELWGNEGALYVGDEPRAFESYAFESMED